MRIYWEEHERQDFVNKCFEIWANHPECSITQVSKRAMAQMPKERQRNPTQKPILDLINVGIRERAKRPQEIKVVQRPLYSLLQDHDPEVILKHLPIRKVLVHVVSELYDLLEASRYVPQATGIPEPLPKPRAPRLKVLVVGVKSNQAASLPQLGYVLHCTKDTNTINGHYDVGIVWTRFIGHDQEKRAANHCDQLHRAKSLSEIKEILRSLA